jgi:hypothetical protein
MFMSAREIDPDTSVDVGEYDDTSATDDFEDLMDMKLDIAKDKGLYYDIERRGVQVPIQVIRHKDGRIDIGHGNHRFAVQRDLDPDALMPVVHTDAVYDDRPAWHDRYGPDQYRGPDGVEFYNPYKTIDKYRSAYPQGADPSISGWRPDDYDESDDPYTEY